MKIIALFRDEKKAIRKAMAQDRGAQKWLYDRYAPKMLGVCRCYIKDLHFAEDAMVRGFFKVFNKMGQYKETGSFEGWVRSIMIRECLDFLRAQAPLESNLEGYTDSDLGESSPNLDLEVEDIQQLIDDLPDGYKTVFVLYAIEGFKHCEIADMLGIAENTSRSQLFKARKILQQQLEGMAGYVGMKKRIKV